MLKQTIATAKVSGVTSQRSRSRVMITDITLLESDSKSIVIFNKDRKMLRDEGGYFIPEVGYEIETENAVYKILNPHESTDRLNKKCIFVVSLVSKKTAAQKAAFNDWLECEYMLQSV